MPFLSSKFLNIFEKGVLKIYPIFGQGDYDYHGIVIIPLSLSPLSKDCCTEETTGKKKSKYSLPAAE